jgi:hypothetical protein
MNSQKSTSQNSKKPATSPTKLSNTPFIILIIAAFAMIAYQWYEHHKKIHAIDGFANPMPTTGKVPYIAQSVFINIYATPEDYPKFQFLFKGSLIHSLLVTNGKDRVMVPKTVKNIPINVFSNSSSTYFTIKANGIEQRIEPCNFRTTTF